MSNTNPKADWFFEKAGPWQEAFIHLRTIALDCGLTEDLKWGQPCYTLGKSNIVLIHGFKEYCAFLFFKGALLKDAKKLLVRQTENVQSARQVRFTSTDGVVKKAAALKSYIKEAIEIERSGVKVVLKKTAGYAVPEEFAQKLTAMPALKAAFQSLTPGRQRAYLLYFGGAKQARTRETRIEKYLPKILDGKGLDD